MQSALDWLDTAETDSSTTLEDIQRKLQELQTATNPILSKLVPEASADNPGTTPPEENKTAQSAEPTSDDLD